MIRLYPEMNQLALLPASSALPQESEDLGNLDLGDFPTGVLTKIFDNLPVESLLHCRLTCSLWNNTILESELLDIKSCFVYDGRKDDISATKCSEYMETSETRNYLWSHIKLRRVGTRQVTWVFTQIDQDPNFTFTISTLELSNSTLNWAMILQLLIECENLEVFMDKQDMYCWDYATFNGGIEENETILETPLFLNLKNRDKLDNLKKLQIVRIHRSQLTECTTYVKIFQLRCFHLKEIDITTDQNFAPQRGSLFYSNLAQLLSLTRNHLKILKFPFKIMSPVYDIRTTDEHRLFREFLTFITDNHWAETLSLPCLEEISIQYGIIPVEGQDLNQKLVPFLQSLTKLKKVCLGTIQLESGVERVLSDFVNQCGHSMNVRFGIVMSDATGVPNINILRVQNVLASLSIQTFRDMTKDLHEIIPMFGLEEFFELKEFQYFSKNHTFRSFNLDLLTESFSQLTQLNLVDHNARLETRHSCEALATIEDADFQMLIKRLKSLVSLQMIGNMTFLTDSGLTGISLEGCKRISQTNQFSLGSGDLVGVSVSDLKSLRSMVLRGLGIKVSDVTAFLAFCDMPYLHKLHLYGCHQVTAAGRSFLSEKYNSNRGCDMSI